jgi:hypothetical protein
MAVRKNCRDDKGDKKRDTKLAFLARQDRRLDTFSKIDLVGASMRSST